MWKRSVRRQVSMRCRSEQPGPKTSVVPSQLSFVYAGPICGPLSVIRGERLGETGGLWNLKSAIRKF